MKSIRFKKIYYLLTFLLIGGFLLGLTSCDEDEYNFNEIEPVIMSLEGPGNVAAHGLTEFPYVYQVPHRGGSSFNWSVSTLLGSSADIVLDDDFPSIAYITFDQSSVEDLATVTVTETTMGGKTSTPKAKEVVLNPFCPEDMDPWAGTWSSDNPQDHAEMPLTVPPQTLNTFVIDGLLGGLVEIGWGENWKPGVGGEGKTTLMFDCGNKVVLEEQLLGETFEWGPYWISGEGTYDPDDLTMTITYNIAWSQGGDIWNTFTSNMTKGSKKSTTINIEIPEK